MADEQQSAEYQELANAIKSVTDQASSSSKNSSDNVKKVARALADLGKVGKLTFTGILDANGNFSSMNNSVTSAGNMLRRLTGTSTVATSSISLMITAIEKTIKSLFGFNDAMIKLHDGLGEYGITVGHSTDQMLKLAHSAGYYLEKSGDFSKLLMETNTSLIALAPTASEAADKLALIFNNTTIDETQAKFLKLGIGPAQLNKMQVNYIKLQAGYGAKLSGNADQIRERSLQYALTVNKLSVLTGTRREEIEQQMAAANLDTKFALKKRMLLEQGNTDAIAAFEQTDIILATTLGKQEAAAFRDFASNQTATTAEGRALMLKTQGQVIAWSRDLEEGRLTPIEVAKLIAQSEKDYVTANSEALKNSEEFQKQANINSQTISGADVVLRVITDADLEKILKDHQKAIDERKNTQNVQLNVERNVNLKFDRLKLSLAGPATNAFVWLITQIKQLATGVLKLALILPIEGKLKENIEDFYKIFGGDTVVKEQIDSMDETVRKISEETELLGKYSDERTFAEKQQAEAEQKNKKLVEQLAAGKKVDPSILRENELNLTKKRAEVAAIKKREADLLKGRTAVQLEAEQKAAIERRAQYKQRLASSALEQYGAKPTEVAGKSVNDYSGLNIKGTESIAGGPVDSKLIELARRIQAAIPGVKFTAFNDLYHKREAPNSKHLKGTALDFTMDPPPKNAEEAKLIKKKLYELGFGTALDEYFTDKSSKSTAGHFHAAFAEGGVATGPKSGYEVTLHGTEAIIPLLSNNTVPLELKNKDNLSDFSSITNSIKSKIAVMAEKINSAAGNDVPNDLLVNMIRGKFVAMISQVEMSNSIQSELKMYLRN